MVDQHTFDPEPEAEMVIAFKPGQLLLLLVVIAVVVMVIRARRSASPEAAEAA